MNPDAPPQPTPQSTLGERLAAEGLSARKSFGQHFLLDLNLTRKIARLAGPLDGAIVLEVGPGPGGLTRALLDEGAARVVAVEKDARFLPLLHDLQATAPDRLSVVQADALEVDEAALLAPWPAMGAARVVANLPYNVATPLLVKWLTGPFQPASMTLMFQKEVAMRIVAAPGEDGYGRLSVLAQAVCRTGLVMTLPARAFTPPPKVDSGVVRLDRLTEAPSQARLAGLETVTRHAFGQRRKMLRSSLRPLGGEALCARAGIEPEARAETVDVAGFLRLAELVCLPRGGGDPGAAV